MAADDKRYEDFVESLAEQLRNFRVSDEPEGEFARRLIGQFVTYEKKRAGKK